jgi:hypothetical protein
MNVEKRSGASQTARALTVQDRCVRIGDPAK